MDSIGFGFERYDPVGAYRQKDDAGNEIDSSGEIVNLAGGGVFADAAEMADKLAEAPEVRQCMSKQWLRFALGRDPEDDDECSLSAVDEVFLKGSGDIKEAILALVTSDAFRLYRGQ